MNLKRAFFFLALLPLLTLTFQSCNTCSETGEIVFSSENQNFSVTYVANDSASTNLISSGMANPNNVSVLLNVLGGRGAYSPISEDLTDGVIGPFDYTRTPKVAQLGVLYDYVYIIQLDTFAVDTFRVFFVPTVDECREYWQGLEWYQNETLLDEFTNSEIVNINRVVE